MSQKIAVVEDNPDNRMLVQALLEDTYEISEYETGVAAVEGLGGDIPDLVLLDISLPDIDGADVLSRMRGDSRLADIPVLALTAHAMSGDRERFLALGFNDYLTKPIMDEKVLFNAIEQALKKDSH